MKIFYCALALLSTISLDATQPAKPVTPTPVVPPKIILTTRADIEKFTREEIAKKTLAAFAKAGKKVPTIMSTSQRIAALLSTLDSLEAILMENGKKIKLSDKYREWERKLIDKVIDDKTTYDLDNEQIVKMLATRKDFNEFLRQAIAIVKNQEKRR
jgi:hypothetical protein